MPGRARRPPRPAGSRRAGLGARRTSWRTGRRGGHEASFFARVAAFLASIGDTVTTFLDAAGQFFVDLLHLHWISLLISLALFSGFLVARSRATFNALRAAYPEETFQWRRVWGAYVAAFGLNGIVPAGSGSIVQLVLTRNSIPNSSFSTVTSALCVGAIYDGLIYTGATVYALTQATLPFPKPKDFASLSSFDLAFFSRHPGATLFALTLLGELVVLGFALLSARVRAFWLKVRQGLAILRQPRRYFVGMILPQSLGWLLRIGSYWYLLEAFHIGGSLRGALLVLAAQAIASIVPFTPGGVGVQQALLLVAFSSTGHTDSVAVFSVGQQIATTGLTLALGFVALVSIFRYRSFREVVRDTRRTRQVERAAETTPA
ncbi:MAG: flippase-like domain-containing protein [Actinobacteria bacterium]|nr:MAG: flippase-like domain-containing protein [Actinomycetota bacterium]